MLRLLLISFFIVGCSNSKPKRSVVTPTPTPKKYPRKISEQCQDQPNQWAQEACEVERIQRKNAHPAGKQKVIKKIRK